MKKTRILHINTMDIGGGASRIAYDLNEGINKYYGDKFESTLLVGRRKAYDSSNVIDFGISKNEINFNGIITRLFGLDSVYSNTFSKKFTKEFIDKYDVIHLHNIHGYFFDIKLLELLKDKKVIWTFHDMWPITGHCAYSYECEKWRLGCYNCELKNEYPKIYLDTSRKMYKMKKEIFNKLNNLTIVTPSQWLADEVKKSFLSSKKIEVIYNGIDTSIFYERDKISVKKKYNINNDKKIILFLAADINDKRKGFKYLVESLNTLENKENYVLISVGSKLNHTIRLKENFEIIELGYIYDKNMLAEIYSLADVFVNPSLSEVFGLTTVESILCKTPVIAFNNSCNSEIIQEFGIIVDNKSVHNLKQTIELNKYLNVLIERKNIEDKYSLNKFIKSYIDIY